MLKEDLLKKISSYKYVSFDLFDTLMFRTVKASEDIHRLTQALYNERYGKDVILFPYKRRYAESRARAYYGYEVNLDEIYQFIEFPPEVKTPLQAIEEECEINNCIRNEVMAEVVEECHKQGKLVIITTDMYLPRKVIEAILSKIAISYDKLYLSNEIRKTKKSGDLYKWILQDLNILPQELIHIGDNILSDIKMANQSGIEAELTITDEQPSKKDSDYLSFRFDSIETNHLSQFFSFCKFRKITTISEHRIGYTVLGPLVYSFCKWIHYEKKENGIERLLFLARDGYLIYQCYKLLYPKDDADYICLNKNLLRLPSLVGYDGVSNFIKSLPPRYDFSWTEFLSHLGIENVGEIKSGESAVLFSADERMLRTDILKGKYNEKLSLLFDSQKEEIEKQTELLEKYLRQNGFFSKTIGLVNNSMEGSSQLLLECIMRKRNKILEVYGLQFTASPSCLRLLGNRVKTFFSGKDEPKWWGRVFRSCPLPFEHLIFEPTGTARRFYMGNDGLVKVRCDDYGREREDFSIKRNIQECALQFISDYKEHIPLEIERISKQMFMTMMNVPYKEDAQLIGRFWDVDVERTRQINPLSGTSRKPTVRMLLTGYPSCIVWSRGYLAEADAPRWFKELDSYRTYLYVYAKQPYWILSDISFYIIGNLERIFRCARDFMINVLYHFK